jgi:hypothetical protein
MSRAKRETDGPPSRHHVTVGRWEWRQLILSELGPKPAGVRLVLLAVSMHINSGKRIAYLSLETIAARAGLARSTTIGHLNTAEREHWLQRFHFDGRASSYGAIVPAALAELVEEMRADVMRTEVQKRGHPPPPKRGQPPPAPPRNTRPDPGRGGAGRGVQILDGGVQNLDGGVQNLDPNPFLQAGLHNPKNGVSNGLDRNTVKTDEDIRRRIEKLRTVGSSDDDIRLILRKSVDGAVLETLLKG